MRKSWIIAGVIVLVVVVVWAVRKAQPEATLAVVSPRKGPISEYVEEQAVTELPHDTLIAMPINGWLERIDLREGDRVQRGQVVARLEQDDLKDRVRQAEHRVAVLETKIRQTKDHRLEKNVLVETEAMVKAIKETVKAAEAKLAASKAVLEFAESEVKRVRGISKKGAASDRELREAETYYRKSNAEYQSDRLELAALKTIEAVSYIGPKFMHDYIDRKSFDLEITQRQLQEAQAQLEMERRNLKRADIASPIDGVVLHRHQTRRQFLQAGTPLLTLGRLGDMEVTAEILTQRATRIEPNDPVEVFGEAVPDVITGKVLRVYPAGFKKISSLGVEQQRVKIAVKLDKRPPRLGVGFRVYVRVIYAQEKDVLTLPRTAMFRGEQGHWQAMVVRDGRTELVDLKVGLMNDERAEIVEGLSAEDQVVARPSREIEPGIHVAVHRDE